MCYPTVGLCTCCSELCLESSAAGTLFGLKEQRKKNKKINLHFNQWKCKMVNSLIILLVCLIDVFDWSSLVFSCLIVASLHLEWPGSLASFQPVLLVTAGCNPEANWSDLACLSSQWRIIPLCNSVTWAHRRPPGCPVIPSLLSYIVWHSTRQQNWCIHLLIFKDRCSI